MFGVNADMATITENANYVGGIDIHPLGQRRLMDGGANVYQRYVLFSDICDDAGLGATPADVQNSLRRLFRVSACIEMMLYTLPVSGIQKYMRHGTTGGNTCLFIDRSKLDYSEGLVLNAIISDVSAKGLTQQSNSEQKGLNTDISQLQSQLATQTARADQEKNRADKMRAYIERIYAASKQTGAQNIDILKRFIASVAQRVK